MERTNDEHISSLRSLLGLKLPKDHDALKHMLRELEVCYIGTMDARIKAQVTLQNKRLQYLHPKDSQYTDMDRKIMLDANVSDAQAEYEQALALEEALKQRVGIIQTLLVQ